MAAPLGVPVMGGAPAALVQSNPAVAASLQQNQQQQQQAAADAYRQQQSTLNALHLAQQLRNTNAIPNMQHAHANGEMAGNGYMNGMHSSAQWQAASAAANAHPKVEIYVSFA